MNTKQQLKFKKRLKNHTYGIDKVEEIINNARMLRACFNEDEGVTYP